MKKLRLFCCLRVNRRSAKKFAAAASNSTLPLDVPASDPALAWFDVIAGVTSIIFTLSLYSLPTSHQVDCRAANFLNESHTRQFAINDSPTSGFLQFTNLNATNLERNQGL
jgi:hypothetical protein